MRLVSCAFPTQSSVLYHFLRVRESRRKAGDLLLHMQKCLRTSSCRVTHASAAQSGFRWSPSTLSTSLWPVHHHVRYNYLIDRTSALERTISLTYRSPKVCFCPQRTVMLCSDNVLCCVFQKLQIQEIFFTVAHALYQLGTSLLWLSPKPKPSGANGTQVSAGSSWQKLGLEDKGSYLSCVLKLLTSMTGSGSGCQFRSHLIDRVNF